VTLFLVLWCPPSAIASHVGRPTVSRPYRVWGSSFWVWTACMPSLAV
jgi:hypothetical protein